MASAIWIDSYDRSVDHSGWRLPAAGDQVIFAKTQGDCYIDHNRVSYDSKSGKVKLRYKKVKPGSTELCSGDQYDTQWSETDGYFYFDREKGVFVKKKDYESWNSKHIKIFLPYATYSVDPGSDTGSYTTWYDYDYLNWLFYDSTQAHRDILKQQHDDPDQRALLTRIVVAKKVVKDLVATTDVRFGFMSFNGSHGGSLDAKLSSDKQPVLDAVDNAWATGSTPLAETLEDSWEYFSDTKKSPIEYWCQKNFVILMTDGYPSYDADDLGPLKGDWDNDHGGGSEENLYHGKGSDYLDDIAYYIYHNDSRSDLEEQQNIYTYTVGFTVANSLLKDAAFNGNGLSGLQAEWDNPQSPHYQRYFYTATNYTELKEALNAAINDIIKKVSSGTAASIISTAQRTENRLFRAKFDPQSWGGFLEAFSLPYDPKNPKPLWDEKADGPSSLRYRSLESRRIFTALDDEAGEGVKMTRRIEFTSSNVDATDADNNPLYKLLGFSDKAEAEDFINYIRNKAYEKYRQRKYKMGDIIHSTPAMTRDTVFVGSNGGLLHAFDINTGMEKWAFIPNNLLITKLRDLARKDYCHEYFVDLSPVVTRLRRGAESKTILLCGERGGGDAYFALDVTEDEPVLLWEFRDTELGETWSMPFIGWVKVGEGERKWAAFIGSGFENNDSPGNLYAIDVEEGTIIGKVALNGSPSDPINSPVAIDSDDNGILDFIYAGDLGGKVFKVSLDSDPASWAKRQLFTALPAQPISTPMSLAFYDVDSNHLFVYFGTGKFFTMEDVLDTTIQSFYAIKDNGVAVARENLTNQTSGCASAEASQGWYIDLVENPGERVTSSPLVAGGIVFFTTFEPDIEDPCKAGGIARLYTVKYDTGCPPDSPVLDVNGDGVVDDGDKIGGAVPRSIVLGHGLPSDIIFNPADNQIIIQTSDTTVHAITVKLLGERIRIDSWRQVFR
jgi:type IV pilus assembly protein PilY1